MKSLSVEINTQSDKHSKLWLDKLKHWGQLVDRKTYLWNSEIVHIA